MKRSICIELLEEYPKATFYTFRFSDEEESEFDKFLTRFLSDPNFSWETDVIAEWMRKIGEEGIINDDYYRPEGPPWYLKALPIDIGARLRVYCYTIGNTFLLFGGGGVKKSQKTKGTPELQEQVNYTKTVGNKIRRYIDLGKIQVVGNLLTGKLCFDIDIQ